MNDQNGNNHEKSFFCISKRFMCLISAGLCIIFFLIFMTGYVWGKRVALEDVLKAIEQKTFADQISGSLYALACANDIKKEESLDQPESVVINVVGNQSPDPEEQGSTEESQDVSISVESARELLPIMESESAQEAPCDASPRDSDDNRCYYAQLIGFGSKKAAEQFVVRLKSCDAHGIVKERISTGAQGKKKSWYQVVTPQYTNKEELERLVVYITKKERLSGVQIIAC